VSTESTRLAIREDGAAPLATGASSARHVGVIVGGLVLLAALVLLSLFVGSGDMTWGEAWHSLTNPGDSTNDVIVQTLRIPRTELAVLVGAALGIAGVVIQAVTRNPLADPGILGVNAGAYFFVAVGAAFFGVTATSGQVWWAIAGSMIAAVVVYVVGTTGRGGATPVKLVLSGVALGAVLTGLSTAISLSHPDVFDKLRFWQAGSIQGRTSDTVTAILPFVIPGLIMAVLLARSLNIFGLGEDLARALGARVSTTRALSFLVITVLCGAATAAAGPITFFGLMVAFVARLVVGQDQRWIIGVSLIYAPAMFLAADIIGRVLTPSEVPVGVVTAFLGAPLLIFLIRRKGGRA
jgi:iron complex transport system permease protein